jgi:hypothetical protein
MRPFRIDIDVADADADGLAATNDSSGATLTLDGALTSGGTFTSADGLAHRLSITDTATQDQSDSTFTVTGTDADGRAQSEAITGPGSGATVESTKYFLTVTSVAITGGDTNDTVSMGTVDEVATKTYPLDHNAETAATVQLDVTGTISVDVQVTLQNPYDQNSAAPFDFDDQEDLAWINDANFGAKTADTLAALGVPGNRAMRVVTNSYSSTAEVQVYVTQPNN